MFLDFSDIVKACYCCAKKLETPLTSQRTGLKLPHPLYQGKTIKHTYDLGRLKTRLQTRICGHLDIGGVTAFSPPSMASHLLSIIN